VKQLTVTQIVAPCSDWYTSESAERGTFVHLVAARLMRGQSATIPTKWDGYAHALNSWLEAMRPTWTHIEKRLVHPTYDYNGRPDGIGVCRLGPFVVDYKTGVWQPWHPLQLAAYDMLAWLGMPRKRFGVYLQSDGRCRVREFTNAGDYFEFTKKLKEAIDGQSIES